MTDYNRQKYVAVYDEFKVKHIILLKFLMMQTAILLLKTNTTRVGRKLLLIHTGRPWERFIPLLWEALTLHVQPLETLCQHTMG